jgi:hypothetical protein
METALVQAPPVPIPWLGFGMCSPISVNSCSILIVNRVRIFSWLLCVSRTFRAEEEEHPTRVARSRGRSRKGNQRRAGGKRLHGEIKSPAVQLLKANNIFGQYTLHSNNCPRLSGAPRVHTPSWLSCADAPCCSRLHP